MNPNGTYKTGNVIGIRLSFDEIVSVNTVGGIPTLTLETGTIDAVINYVS